MPTATKLHPKLAQLLCEGAALGATDLYLVPGEPLTVRIDGQIQRTEGEILTAADIDDIAVAALGEERLAKLGTDVPLPGRLWWPADVSYARAARTVLMRVSRSCGQHTIYVQLDTPVIADVEQLCVPEAVLKASLSSSGLVIFSGRMGSGHLTTAYSVVDYINANRACHISTSEDPIHVRFTPKRALVRQYELGGDAPSTRWVIRAARLQDVDVLFVSPIRDMEACNAVWDAVETGSHLIVATTCAADRPQDAIERIVGGYTEYECQAFKQVLARRLRAVCCQRLLPGVKGGRVAAYSVLMPDTEMRNAIAEGRDPMVRPGPMPPECQTMEEAIQRLLDQGKITPDTASKALTELA